MSEKPSRVNKGECRSIFELVSSMGSAGVLLMFNSETTTLLRTVLDEVCGQVSLYENGTRAHVASKLLEAAAQGELTIDALKETGRKALGSVPTMWR